MHEDINPYNLGPVVYKYEQIITLEDLENIMAILDEQADNEYLDHDQTARYETFVRVLEVLRAWIKTGKADDLSLGGYK